MKQSFTVLFIALVLSGCDLFSGSSGDDVHHIKDLKLDQVLLRNAEDLRSKYQDMGGEEKAPNVKYVTGDRPLYRIMLDEEVQEMGHAKDVVAIAKNKTLEVPEVLKASIEALGTDVLPIGEMSFFDEKGRIVMGDKLYQIVGTQVIVQKWSTLETLDTIQLEPYSIKSIRQYAIDHALPPAQAPLNKTASDNCVGNPVGDDCRVRTSYFTVNGKQIMTIEYHDAYTAWLAPRVASSTELLYYDTNKNKYLRVEKPSLLAMGLLPTVSANATFYKWHQYVAGFQTIYNDECPQGCTEPIMGAELITFTSEGAADLDGYVKDTPSGRAADTRIIKSAHQVGDNIMPTRELITD